MEPNSVSNQHESTSSASTSLLPEIWLLVFPYLKHADIQSISLTCSTFRYMAQPLLFSVLDVSPFLLSYNADQPILRPTEYLERFLQRLEYYKLPHIAHGVQHCWISPYSRSGFPTRNQNDDLDPNLIIDAVVDVLPQFTNLSFLSWHCIDIAPRWWNIIHSLRIKKLWLNSSSIPLYVDSPLQHITHLDLDQWPWEGKITNHVSIHEERARGVNTLALQHVIHPDVIQSISVPRYDTACHLYSTLARTTYHLRSLKIPFSSISYPSFIEALEHCPSLTSLCVFPPSSDERSRDIRVNAFTSSVLPSLKNYEGPYSHVLGFSQQPLQNVALWGFDERPDVCDPDKLTDVLKLLAESASTSSLKRLKLSVLKITNTLLNVFASFENLESLVLVSTDNSSRDSLVPMPQSFKSGLPISSLYFMMDTTVLSPRIKYVKVTTRLTSPRQDLAAQEGEAAQFMEAFASRHPTIQRIEIEYGIYWTGMYLATWGRIRENNATPDLDEVDGGDYSSSSQPPNTSSKNYRPTTRVKDEDDGGYLSKSSSKDYILSTVVHTVHPLPLGKLTFTEHRRKILFPQDTLAPSFAERSTWEEIGDRRPWTSIWMGVKRLFQFGRL